MMEVEFQGLLTRYGAVVTFHHLDGSQEVGRCFMEAILDRQEQWAQSVPSPLGMTRQDRFVYYGEPGLDLERLGAGEISCRGVRYRVQTVQPVYVGESLVYWWGILQRIGGAV